MSIITLLTDWQKNDYYTAVTKARILSEAPNVQIIDINHQIEHFHIAQASFLLHASLKQFPKGSIHIFAIQSANIENSSTIIGKYKGQYIISSDNGIFNALPLKFDQLIEIKPKESSFPELDIFAPLAIKIIQNENIETLGSPTDQTHLYNMIRPTYEDDKITCTVSYIDSYGNIIVNLQEDEFLSYKKGRSFDIFINSFRHKTNHICTSYSEVPKNEIFALFNSSGYLEIGMRMANISEILNLSENSSIIIKFKP